MQLGAEAPVAWVEPADAGEITVLGHDLSRLTGAERARLRQRRIGIVFQSFGLIASLRAGENVALPLALAGVPEEERKARARDALAEARVEAERIVDATEGALRSDGDLLAGAERIPIEHALAAVRRLAGQDDHRALVAAVSALNAATEEFAARRMNRGVGRALTGRSVDALG